MRFTGRTAVRAAALIGSLVLAAGCTASGGGTADGGTSRAEQKQKTPKTARGTLEQLAARTECEPRMQTDAEELRQGVCTTGDGRYVLATFATAGGQQSWLAEAKPYGGTYLVGEKWVAVGEPGVLGKLRGRLGGAVESGASHSGDGGGDGGAHSGGDGHGGHRGHG
ncbi:hypothetical protein CUT44_01710 [Streptomyces carminius]|uniref:Lipoprotein n=1 Tax=Streptomyces carminius TaxID=2665496 RepID=A0A2M8MC73_9ACTN|nr:hypothetical protein [Streptomyces carminius]PJE97991.1 hypothetical protein CUT44_09970 [Streptomyces carminius]PJF01817.1 hypothetical protein CUT44_01710 [Streptomyces carminius]